MLERSNGRSVSPEEAAPVGRRFLLLVEKYKQSFPGAPIPSSEFWEQAKQIPGHPVRCKFNNGNYCEFNAVTGQAEVPSFQNQVIISGMIPTILCKAAGLFSDPEIAEYQQECDQYQPKVANPA